MMCLNSKNNNKKLNRLYWHLIILCCKCYSIHHWIAEWLQCFFFFKIIMERGFLAILQYFGKDIDDSVDIQYLTKQGRLNNSCIEYNGEKFTSIFEFVQKANNDIENKSTEISSKQLAKTFIHGVPYTKIRSDISRTPNFVVVEHKEEEAVSNVSIETTLSFDPSRECTYSLQHVLFHVRHCDGVVQLEFLCNQKLLLDVHAQGDEYEFKNSFSIKPEESVVFPTTLNPSINSSATIVIKEKITHEPKLEYFKIEFDEVSHNVIVFTYPTQRIWGKGKAYNSQGIIDGPITYTNINTTKITFKNENRMRIQWRGGMADVLKTDFLDLSRICYIFETQRETELQEKCIGAGMFIDPGKTLIMTCAHILQEARVRYISNRMDKSSLVKLYTPIPTKKLLDWMLLLSKWMNKLLNQILC